MDTMTVGELMDFLKDYPEDMPVIAFTEGRTYPVLNVEKVEGDETLNYSHIEFGCGWVPCDMYSDDDNDNADWEF